MAGQGAVGKGRGEVVAIDAVIVFHANEHRKIVVAIYQSR